MGCLDMVKYNEDISKNTLEVLYKASSIYDILKEHDVKVGISTTSHSSIISDLINNYDKKSLSILLSFFFVNCTTKKMFDDYNITLDNFLDLIYNENNEKLFTEEELKRLVFHNKKENINNDIEVMTKRILNDFGYLSTPGLLVLLYDTSYSASRLINTFLPCVLEYSSPFIDSKAFYEILSRTAMEIEEEKSKDSSFISKKVSKLKEKNSNSIFSLLNIIPKKEQENIIKKYGTYLTDISYQSNPAVGRKKELEKAKVTLLTEDKSLILVGPGGVGKTAIVEGLAYDIEKGNVPDSLKNKKILSINTASLVSGCKYVGSFEEVVKNLFQEIEKEENIILFIDELHTVFGLGAGSNSTLDFANILKPYLGRGKIKMIGATTSSEYDRIIATDSAFKRRFERLDIKEPTNDTLLEIAEEIIKKLEEVYKIKFLNNYEEKIFILKEIIKTTDQAKRIYDDKSSNPDLVITIIEKAFAYAKYNDNTYVTKEDISCAIMDCDRIYESVRESTKDLIRKKYNEKKHVKVINFPQKD